MDNDNEDEYELEADNSDYVSDVGEEEEVESEITGLDSWESFHDRIDALVQNEHCEKPVRKLDARRLTVLQRVRQQFHEAPKSIADRARSKKNQIEQQLELSNTRLGELVRFGNELVTNIRVANERRELDRRQFESKQRSNMDANLKAESIEALAKFADIKARWTELDEINEPMMLWDQIELQKQRIAEIMERKDDMIEACQQEIDRMNAKYEYDRERQAADLSCLVERVDHQIETLKDAYRQHLKMLRHTIEDERQLFSLTAVEKWRSFFDALNANFDEKSEILKTRQQFYSMQAQLIGEAQEELTKSTRIRLEKQCECLELELRRTRDNVLMNSEKLDYNYQVLQKRNEENVIINNQQKRRVARLHEVIGRTRRKLKKVHQQGKQTIARLSAEIYKLHSNINVMEVKAHQARLCNKEKFDRIWEINYNELMNMVNRVFSIDRILHEQQLVMPWSQPDLDVTNINAQGKKSKNIMKRFDLRAGKVPKNRVAGGGMSKKFEPDIKELSVDDMRLMRNIMRKLSDRGGFLIEERLLKILDPYSEKDKTLVRIDNIFAALRVRRLRDIHEMSQIFAPYTYCPTCQPAGLSPQKCAEVFMQDQKHHRYLKLADVEMRERKNFKKRDDANPTFLVKDGKYFDCPNHYLVMEPALILHALTLYTNQMHKRLYESDSDLDMNAVNYITMDDETICNFWSKFNACFPDSKRKLWKILEHGLNHYVDVLKMREQYDGEVMFLRRQNVELRHLLQKFKV